MNWDWEKLQQRQHERSRGSGDGGGQPPHIDDVLNKLKDFKFKGGWALLIVLAVVIMLGSSMVYTVASNEVGVIQRFGKYIRTTQSGLHFKLPVGIEKVTKVKTKRVYTEKFGLETNADGGRIAFDQQGMDVALMLTGDLNVGIVPWIVQYRVKDPFNYLFKVDDVQRLIRDMAESSMRLVVGDRSINEVISKRQEIAVQAETGLQKDLNEAETGIEIVTVELGNTNVPQPVQDSFNEVNRAVQQKEETIYKARREYNMVIPKASGEAQKTIESAKGYATERINRAKGDADRFESRFQAYSSSRDVTRRRLYLEMLEGVLPELGDKYIIDSQQDNLLPLLNLGKDKGKYNAAQ